MNLFGISIFGVGYAIFYWAANILVQSYKRAGTAINPPTLPVCLGIPGANSANTNPLPPPAAMSGGPSPSTPGTTQPPVQPSSLTLTPSTSQSGANYP